MPRLRRVIRRQTIDGLSVENITKPMRLTISEKEAKTGKSKAPSQCAAALAAVRQVPRCTEARVHVGRIFLKVGKKWLRGKVSAALRTEIATFDRGGTFAPGEYIIRPLAPSDLPTGRRIGGKDKPRNGKKPKRRLHVLVGVRESGKNEYRR
jgi:hypothetical protein